MNTIEYLTGKYAIRTDGKPPFKIGIDRTGLAALFCELGYTHGIEIGTASGEFAEELCKANPRLFLGCVDLWQRYPGYNGMKAADLEACYYDARERMHRHRAVLLRMSSMQAADYVPDGALDFVYIDANHELPWIIDDICAWAPKVREGGIVAGHDYHAMNDKCHVKYALDCYTSAKKINPWFILGDRYTSWFYVKGRTT